MSFESKYTTVVPIFGNGVRLGTLILGKFKKEFIDSDLLLSEYAATVIGMQLLHDKAVHIEEASRKKAMVQIAFSNLSYSELEAISEILKALPGDEGLLVASKIADQAGITRSVIVNALRKFESAGVLETESLGMKGTYVRILNEYLRDGLKEHRNNLHQGCWSIRHPCFLSEGQRTVPRHASLCCFRKEYHYAFP